VTTSLACGCAVRWTVAGKWEVGLQVVLCTTIHWTTLTLLRNATASSGVGLCYGKSVLHFDLIWCVTK